MHLFTDEIKEIKKYDDIINVIDYVLKNPNQNINIKFIGIEPLELRFQGKRFNQEYLPVEFFNILKTFEIEYINYFENITKQKFKKSHLNVKVERACLKDLFEGNIPNEVIQVLQDKLNPTSVLLTLLFSIGCWFGNKAYKNYLAEQTKRLENNSNSSISQDSLSLAKDVIKILSDNLELEKSKNRPINQSIIMLEQDENILFGREYNTNKYNRNNDIDFPYTVSVDNNQKYIYSDVINTYIVKGINEKNKEDEVTLKLNNEKSFQAKMMISNDEIHKIYKSKETKETITLRLKIGKDSESEIKNAIILGVIQE